MYKTLSCVALGVFLTLGFAADVSAKSKEKIDRQVNAALTKLYDISSEAKILSGNAKAILVFPKVKKAGIGLGGAYGQGALRIGGKSQGYYSTSAGSIGLQLGFQSRSEVIMFMEQSALDQFLDSDGWKIGADASVAIISVGEGAGIDTTTGEKPIVGFIYGDKGLMYNLTLEGSKISKLDK